MAERDTPLDLPGPGEIVGKSLAPVEGSGRSMRFTKLLVFAVVVLGVLFAALAAWAVVSGRDAADNALLQNRQTTIEENTRTRAIECSIERRLYSLATPSPPSEPVDECGVPVVP